ncbi:MAG TPA: efflux RND transporter periplasmic adaptor subunit, partial [Thiothrix sp.]|nr:efflux RND transporter periplasmic adaptor subunit [Thiothrix sp.]
KDPEPQAVKETALDHAAKHADPNYICPMHPQISQKEKGSCPICGMDLVKKAPEKTPAAGSKPSSKDEGLPDIKIDPTTAQNMGIRTHRVKRQSLTQTIEAVGYIAWNEDKMQHIHARSNGWIEVFNVRAVGDQVKQGDLLLEYYSPELFAAQKDFILSLDNNGLISESSHQRLMLAASNKLILLGVPERLIEQIRTTRQAVQRIPIYAPQNGTVTKLSVREGMYITPSTELYTITDLSSVWLLVDIFAHQVSDIQQNAKATVQLDGYEKAIAATVDYIYPEISLPNRTLQVRLQLDNPQARLKPNMFANVQIEGKRYEGLTIPSEALIPMHAENRVVKRLKEGRYQPVAVETGIEVDQQILVRKGLKAGDEIIVSGQFLIDSESNLQASFRRMSMSE